MDEQRKFCAVKQVKTLDDIAYDFYVINNDQFELYGLISAKIC